jgi:hypothetical protein
MMDDAPPPRSPARFWRGGKGKATNATTAIDAKQTVPIIEMASEEANATTSPFIQSLEEENGTETDANDVHAYPIWGIGLDCMPTLLSKMIDRCGATVIDAPWK